MADEKIMDTENVSNFIHDIIDRDLAEGRVTKVHTRFPPEPNGYLHIGSAKAIWINSGTAQKYNGLFNLRFDDTNPVREDDEYVKSIEEDLRWLGAEPTGGIYYGSDYFDKCYEYAVKLIKDGKAYVDDLTADEMREYRGTLTEPGKESPWRNRSVEENLDLFERMKNGEFPDGSHTLRAKIDMASPNMNMRDPAIYRIVHAHHHRQATSGASTRCTTSPTRSRTRWRASPTRCARSSLKTTARCTTGLWTTSALSTSPTSTSLPA